MKYALALAAGLAFCSATECRSQELSPQQLHDAIAESMARVGGAALPSGDTLVSWTTAPILYHTVAASPVRIRSGMLRNDGMLGIEETHWTDGALTKFTSTWKVPDSVAVTIHGQVADRALHLTSPRNVSFAIPKIPWGVADYGMEEHLVPMFNALPDVGGTQEIAVFRPYILKWDTVTVTVNVTSGFRVVQTFDKADRTMFVVSPSGTLLWCQHLDHPWQRRPLEQTPLYQDFVQARALVGMPH
jgi:hypothetical protein